MTRTGSGKPVSVDFAPQRLIIARSYLAMAEAGFALAEPGTPQNPVLSNIILAAIAYCDALTAKNKGRINQKDHGAVAKALRDAMGNRLPTAQETKLNRILFAKDQVQYGAKSSTIAEAEAMLKTLRDFARWAEDEFAR